MIKARRNPRENILVSTPKTKSRGSSRKGKMFKALSENVPGAVYEYVFNKDGTSGFKYLSPAIVKMFGIPAKNYKNSFDHVHPDDRARLILANQHSQLTNEPFYFEGRIILPDGRVRWHSAASSFSYKTKTGARVFTGIILDITSRIEMQQEQEFVEQQKKKDILQAVLEAHERERQEIANELHENISQSLSSCKLLLDMTMRSETIDAAIIGKVLSHIDKSINELRNISYSLSTSALQLIGFPQALTDLITRMTGKYKVAIYLDANKFRSVRNYDPKVYLTIYRVVQEQLLNIVKHSDATQVRVILKIERDKICVEVTDNGHGFDLSSVQLGLGLRNLFNRVEHYNGKIEIDSQPGQGCCLKASMPYK